MRNAFQHFVDCYITIYSIVCYFMIFTSSYCLLFFVEQNLFFSSLINFYFLHSSQAMKTYHAYQNEAKNAENKLQEVQAQKKKLEQQLQGKTGTTRGLKRFERREDKVS